ncbi:MAG: polysaccharide deacetylase family protein [Planctomycetes bacterium]|nr:polysaccharide deacetylase family protein [Planctomycetota bacterium]
MYVYNRRGLIVRLIWLCIAIVRWLAAGCGIVGRPRVVTLCYHGVTARQRRRFERQITWIADRAVPPDAAELDLRRRRARPGVCVTFDDGFANLLDHALPVTRELGIPAMVFVVTENLGCRPKWDLTPDHPDASQITLSESQLRQAAEEPLCRFASHSSTHPRLTDLPLGQARRELSQSKAVLEQMLGRPVEDFAYPYGACNPTLVREAFASGYRRIHTMGPITMPGEVCGEVIVRMKMSPDAWTIEFRLTVAGAYDWLASVRRVFHRLRQARSAAAPSATSQLQAKAPGA